MKKLTKITLALLLIFSLSLTACSKEQGETKSDDKLKVYTSIYPMYEFTKMIAGDKADIELLIPAGQSPHDWEPGQDDMLKLEKADMLVYNGLSVEAWVEDLVSALDNKELIAVNASDGADLIELDHSHEDEDHEHENEDHDHEGENHDNHEHHHGKYDPHIWLDPKNAIVELGNIRDAFITKDPENKDFYEKNFEESKKKMEELDDLYKTELADVKNKTIVVSHEAYGYICKEYGLEQRGIQGIFEESEPDSKTIAEIIDLVNNENITTIFTEELIDTKVADSISKQTGAKTEYLNPLEGLSEEEANSGMDYFSIMKSNLEKLVEALN